MSVGRGLLIQLQGFRHDFVQELPEMTQTCLRVGPSARGSIALALAPGRIGDSKAL